MGGDLVTFQSISISPGCPLTAVLTDGGPEGRYANARFSNFPTFPERHLIDYFSRH